jgi:hypothetical protein
VFHGQLLKFSVFLNNKRQKEYQNKSVPGQFASRRHTKIHQEIEKELSFSPKINKTVDNRQLDFTQKRYLALLEDGMFDDVNEYLIKELDELQEISIDQTPKDTQMVNHYFI